MEASSLTPLNVWQNEEALAVLIRLYEDNPAKIEQLREAVDLSDDNILSLVKKLSVFGLVETDEKLREFKISPSGKLFVEQLGITKDNIRERKQSIGMP